MRLLTLAVLTSALLAAGPAHADAITADSVLELMNQHRAANQLPPLVAEKRIMDAAEDRMRDMEELGYWAHQSPDGRSPFFWLKFRSYRFTRAGENLARGFETAELLVSTWMDSPGHRSNILSADFSNVGIALIDGATTGRYPGKSVVVLFGRE